MRKYANLFYLTLSFFTLIFVTSFLEVSHVEAAGSNYTAQIRFVTNTYKQNSKPVYFTNLKVTGVNQHGQFKSWPGSSGAIFSQGIGSAITADWWFKPSTVSIYFTAKWWYGGKWVTASRQCVLPLSGLEFLSGSQVFSIYYRGNNQCALWP